MAGNLIENFNELCRLCASKTNIIIGINIFENEGKVREIYKKISACLPVQVHEKDELPKILCGNCVYKLDLCFGFRQKSIEAETLLIELLQDVTNINKNRSDKILRKQSAMDIATTIASQQLSIVEHSQELLNSTLAHNLTESGSLIVNQGILLNHENIVMNNHGLDNIQFSTNSHEMSPEVPHPMSHEIAHEISQNNIQNQHLHLHDESAIAQLVQQDMRISDSQLDVQNLELIHEQHNLMSEEYGIIQDKSSEPNQNCIERPFLTIKNQSDLIAVKDEQDIKKENQIELVRDTFTAQTDSDESTDDDFDNSAETIGENIKRDDGILTNGQIYEEQKHVLLNHNEIDTSLVNDIVHFYCNVCEKTVTDKNDYMSHYAEHFNKCTLCNMVFTNAEALETHRRQIHSKRSTSLSPKLQISSKSRPRFKSETKDDIDDNFFKEESSEEDRRNSTEFQEDEEENEDDSAGKNGKRKKWEPKVCKECGKTYKTNYKLAEHMRRHTGEQPYKCSVCDKAFRSKIGLAQHAAKHTGQYDYSCPTCGKGFQCKSYLIVHQRVHSDVKPYPCTTCGQNFKTKQSLLDHKNRHLGVKPYMCEVCGRGFITKGLCKSHQKVHSGTDNRQFPCTVCNKLFVSKSYLATHVRIHTGEKPFMCEVCGKGFLTRVDLRIHSTMHTGEKSFVCEMCGKAFARRDALRCHRRSHTGERPYSCNICGQSFTQFSPMAIHKRLHTGERPYSCEVCNKTFVSRSTMMSHRKKHTP